VSAPEGMAPSPWADATLAASLFAVDPAGIGGVLVRSLAGPVRDQWLAHLREVLPEGAPLRRVPLHVTDGRLLGGLDLASTLRAGRPVAERGLLVEANEGVLVLAMAERISGSTAARLTAALDTGEVVLERDGLAMRTETRFGVVALDEGIEDEERPPNSLRDRLAFHLDLTPIPSSRAVGADHTADDVAEARERLASITTPPDLVDALCGTALALGIDSIRAPMMALRIARAAAALAGRDEVAQEDAVLAGRLVFSTRATRLPPMEAPPESDEEPPPEEEEQEDDENQENHEANEPEKPLEDMVLEAIQAAIPAGLLAQLREAGGKRLHTPSHGKAGAVQHSKLRGRPAGTRAGEPRAGARLNVVETLRAAAPWQPLRRRETTGSSERNSPRVEVRPDDFRVTRFKQRTQTTTIFTVDASGSAALHRLAEAKGAVELLLADCYVRRDQVAMIAFRGTGAELILPPTRSLVRAKRCLSALPGGGGTPLALGIDAAVALADSLRRRGETPVIIVLTDGRANIARDGEPGRARAEEDAISAARSLRELGITALMVDMAPQPQPSAKRLATEMDGMYLALPYADANVLSKAVIATTGSSSRK
jgi:magnesium chelatase subunit D